MSAVNFPVLDIVPLQRCRLHESVDPPRVNRIAASVASEGILRNPPIVGQHRALDGLFVLDGATRVSALRQIKLDVGAVQIVDYEDPAIKLFTWAHLLPATVADRVLGAFRELPGVAIHAVSREAAHVRLHCRELLCCVHTPDGQTWAIEGGTSLADEARLLDEVFNRYTGQVPVERIVPPDNVPDAGWAAGYVAVIFPRYTKSELVQLVADGVVLPGGITRHVIPGRALRVNLPLALLQTGDLDDQREWLRHWMRHRQETGAIRLYNEPAWLFDD